MSRTWGMIFACLALLLFTTTRAVQAQSNNYFELRKGVVKVIRAGRSYLIWNKGAKVSLLPGDKLHSGPDTHLSVIFSQDNEAYEIYSNAFFEFQSAYKRKKAVAILTGKVNFALPPAASSTDENESSGGPLASLRVKLRNRKLPEDQKNKILDSAREFMQSNFSQIRLNAEDIRRPRLAVRTVSAIIGVRGTEFVVATQGDSTSILTLTGLVGVASPDRPNVEIAVPANSVSQVKEGMSPTAPVEVAPAAQEAILQSDAPEAFETVTFGEAVSLESTETQAPQEAVEAEAATALDQVQEVSTIEEILDQAEDALETLQAKPVILQLNIEPR